jgi:hypothetical protein
VSPRDDGRLELDEDGRLLDGDGAPVVDLVDLVDLEDPHAVEELAPPRVRPWLDANVAPWVRAHRRAVIATGVAAAVLLTGLVVWRSRPPEVAPVVALELENAILDGNDLGGPEITGEELSVAYAGRAVTAGDRVEVLALAGPGLVQPRGAGVLTSTERSRLVLGATIDCRDPALTTATPASYGLTVRRTSAGGDVLETTAPFGAMTTELDLAVLSHCVAQLAPAHLVIESARADSEPGQPTAALSLLVRNTGPVPLTVATERRATTGIEIDLSPTVVVPPGESSIVTTRALVHDCLAVPSLPSLEELPGPVPWAARSAPGVALQVGLGQATTLASFPLVGSALGRELADGACRGARPVTAELADVVGRRGGQGGWEVDAVYRVRSEGIRLRIGREHFDGPAAGSGSIITTPTDLLRGGAWTVGPTQLDGGAGRVTVTFLGSSCGRLDTSRPTTLPVGVTMPDRRVYTYEVPVDDVRLIRAAYAACGLPSPSSLVERGWALSRTA